MLVRSKVRGSVRFIAGQVKKLPRPVLSLSGALLLCLAFASTAMAQTADGSSVVWPTSGGLTAADYGALTSGAMGSIINVVKWVIGPCMLIAITIWGPEFMRKKFKGWAR